jgi:hypothetical protein
LSRSRTDGPDRNESLPRPSVPVRNVLIMSPRPSQVKFSLRAYERTLVRPFGRLDDWMSTSGWGKAVVGLQGKGLVS